MRGLGEEGWMGGYMERKNSFAGYRLDIFVELITVCLASVFVCKMY
jgi:hypothetical protein